MWASSIWGPIWADSLWSQPSGDAPVGPLGASTLVWADGVWACWADGVWFGMGGFTPQPQAQQQQAGGTSRKKRRPKTYAEVAHAKVAELSLDVPQVETIEEQDEDEIILLAAIKAFH